MPTPGTSRPVASARAAFTAMSDSAGISAGPAMRSIVPARPLVKAQLVAEIDELHRRLQQVIAVGATADDVQAEIELRRRGPGERRGFHWPSRQRSTTMRTRAVPLLALIFTGTRAPGSVE